MTSKHKSAPRFLRKRFFEGIKSFKEFEARVGKLADTVEMGDALEILVEAHLHLDEVMKAKDVWVVGSIPQNIRKTLNLPNDSKGIDGVYEDQAGNYIPYQVKYRTDMDTLPYGEISAFLGITEKSLQDRMIFTNARKLSVDVANRTGVRSFRADKFHELTEADFRRINDWLTDKKVETGKRWDPLPHQKAAIEKITEGLKEADRTTAVMACGTGKTLVALWAAEAQDPKTVLVLVPSLALLSQTLPDWCKQTSWGERFRYLCVCSDASVDRSAKEDGYALRQQDLEFSVTTDPNVVKGFLADNKSGVNVIFSTYQSAEVVAEGLKEQTVDLGIFDEAHKTTGPKEGLFAFGLSDKNIRIKKRLFLTATPRHYKLNKRDKDGDFQVVSMSDEAVYGKVSYRLPFSTAVAAGIIVPYKVIISVSLNKDVDAELLRRGSTRVRRDEIQAKWVANQIALKRAIEKTAASKIITFHSRVNLAEDFAGDDARGFKEHVKGFDVFHVNGSQNAADRKALLEGFKTAPKGLITNARCLTEGVDVPAVDMVAFVDPRKSKIDIAQAAGRAMRQSKATQKKLGYIVVPLFIEQNKGETEVEAFTRSGFDEVAEVLAAMLESDDDLVDTIKEMQEARGRGEKFNPRQLHEKIQVIGPAINLDKLTESIDVEILDRLGVNWDRWFGLLCKFHARTGHCRVAGIHLEDGLSLGTWVEKQRVKRFQLSQNQVRRLDSLGFSWDPIAEQWDLLFLILQKFKDRTGHCLVSSKHSEEGVNLGTWVEKQRSKKSQLSPLQIAKLDSIGFSWDPREERWMAAYSAVKEFRQREGHCSVPSGVVIGGLDIGIWVMKQREKKSSLSKEKIGLLDEIEFNWDPREERWKVAFETISSFFRRKGHCRPPNDLMAGDINLRTWIEYQRSNKNSLSEDQIRKLNSLGFSWDPVKEKWEEAFILLKKFHEKHGHSRVPGNHSEDGLKLGNWVMKQRENFSRLSHERIKRLNMLDFSWDPITEQWEIAFNALTDFKKREGHCRVPPSLESAGLNLGNWVMKQREKRSRLTPDQIQRLNSLGFSWDPITEQWEIAFNALKAYYDSNGHCNVPVGFHGGGVNLGIWTISQRSRKSRLAPDQLSRLNGINFCWDPIKEKWDKAYAALVKFHKREGHCHVGKDVVIDGVKLGHWASNQRQKKSKLNADRIKRLNSLNFNWSR